MQFTFSDEQDALRAAVRGFVDDRVADGYVRSMIDDELGFTTEVWEQVVELGWTGLLVPEGHGGLGLGLVEAVVVCEELGRQCFPGPFLSSAVAATIAARRLGLDDRLEAMASGRDRGTVAIDERGHGDPVDRMRTRATRRGAAWQLTGLKVPVLDGAGADWVLVPARTQEGIGTFLVARPAAEREPALDVTRRVARLRLDATPAERVGPPGDHTGIWRRVADDVAVALCAELVGSAEQAFHLAVDYAKERVQFGRPIATFQAIKHKAAEMLQRIELARVGTHYAAWASDADDGERAVAASMAKAEVAAAAIHVTGESIQIHGGVGFTWDCDAHLHYRRAKQNDLLLGGQSHHRARVARRVLQPS